MKLNFLTYFDVHYAARGLTMIESLFRHHPRAALSVLCVDAKTAEIVQAVHGDRAGRFTSEQLAAEEPRLAGLRAQRAGWEFYASQKPIFIRMAMDRMEPDELAVYIDADCYFHAGIEEALAELEGASVGITPHRFSPECENLHQYGAYNAGFVTWRNDRHGRACLLDWAGQCLDWCYLRVEGERFMNQGYLTAWPERFQGVKALRHPGLNVGPWNLASHCLESGPSGVRVDGRPLLILPLQQRLPLARGGLADDLPVPVAPAAVGAEPPVPALLRATGCHARAPPTAFRDRRNGVAADLRAGYAGPGPGDGEIEADQAPRSPAGSVSVTLFILNGCVNALCINLC